MLAFTHGGVLDIAYRLTDGRAIHAERDYPLLKGSLNWIEYRAGRWKVIQWAQQAEADVAAGGAANEMEGEGQAP